MSQFIVKKSKLRGTIKIPPSKSHTLRALLFAAMAEGKSIIREYLPSTDSYAMIEGIKQLGAKVELFPSHVEITGIAGKLGPFEDVVHAGNSGIVLRFLSALAALSEHPFVITGDHSIRHQRPMKPLAIALRSLGASVTSLRGDDFAPLIIKGPLTHTKTKLNGQDSQPVSALLIAAAFKSSSTQITVHNPGELPWIDMTLGWFRKLGIKYENDNYTSYEMFGKASYAGFDYTVPGDFSSAAFPLSAAIITDSPLILENLDMDDAQGDKELITILQKMGANIEIDASNKRLLVHPGANLKGVKVDINNFVDAVTILATIACYAEGETTINGAAVARNKECNRLSAITSELRKMKGNISETPDGLIINRSTLQGAEVHSHQDHRMAMSLAVGALGAEGITRINSSECVAKTYPTFLKEFQSLGANIHE